MQLTPSQLREQAPGYVSTEDIMIPASDAMDTFPSKYLSPRVHVQYLDGSNVCCSVESTRLRHLASRGADNDKTGVLLTFTQND